MISDLADWRPFFSVEAGTAGSLIGLIFVSLSVSHVKILTIPRLLSHSLSSITILGLVLGISLCAVAPQASFSVFAGEIIVLTAFTGTIAVLSQRDAWRMIEAPYRVRAVILNLGMLCILVLQICFAAGVWMFGIAGLSLALPASILSFIAAITHAWIVIVEVHR